MTYTGDVAVSGPADVRELSDLIISKAAVGELANNAYLLRCRASGEQLLIDAPDGAETLLALIGNDGLAAVVITHGHPDHWQGLEEVVAVTGAPVVAHANDADLLPVTAQRLVGHGERIRFGRIELEVVHLRGHTDGSIALVYDDPHGHAHIFTGDSLFPGGVGNTWGDKLRFRSLIDDVDSRIFHRFGDETWIYPGHGPDSTLGRERPELPQWRERGW